MSDALKLKIRAIELHISGAKIARDMGVSNATVSAWFRGDRPVPIERAEQLAELLKMPVIDLLPESIVKIIRAAEGGDGKRSAR